jgi:hypothetical protein
MIKNLWKILSALTLVFGIQGAFAGEAWVVITSDLPEVAVSVDDAYRGVTPQRPGDALRIRVDAGARVIEAHKRVNGQEYAMRQIVEVTGRNENFVQFNLRQKSASVLVTPPTPPVQDSTPWFGRIAPPLGKLEVPGRNF